MATTKPDSISPHAIILQNDAILFTWTPDHGPKRHTSDPILEFNTPLNLLEYPVCLEKSCHPLISYMSVIENLYRIDLRAQITTSLKQHLVSPSEPFTTILQHDMSPNHLIASTKDRILLFDIRFMKDSVGQRPIPVSIDMMRLYRGMYT